MKTSFCGFKASLVGIQALLVLAFSSLLPVCGAGEDVNALFQMGRSAYYKGDLETAHQLLSQVAVLSPQHFETKAQLARIKAQMPTNGGASLKKQYSGVILKKVEFTEVTLQEALDGLRSMAKAKTDGKLVPNFIVRDGSLTNKTISLYLSEVPLTDVIQYLAQMSLAKATYDQYAVVFTSAAASSQ